jgi:hypothetical protein
VTQLVGRRFVGVSFEGGDFGHDAVGYFLVDLFEARLGAGFGFGAQGREVDGAAVFYGDAARARDFVGAAEGFVGAEDADRDDGGVGFDDGEADAGAGGLEGAVFGAGAFGEKEDRAAGEEAIEDGAQARGAAAVAIDGDGVPGAEDGADDGETKKGFAREVVDGALEAGADEGRVDKAGVVGGENDGAGERDVFGIVNAPAKVGGVDESEERPTDEVAGVHRRREGTRILCERAGGRGLARISSRRFRRYAEIELTFRRRVFCGRCR